MKKILLKSSLVIAVMALTMNVGHTQCPTDTSLLACYSFSGNANDETGNGNDGTLFGPVLAMDEMGTPNNAYEFDGIDDWINMGDGGSFRFQAGRSFSLVAKVFVEQPTDYGNILRYDDFDESDGDSSPNGIRDVIVLRINDQGSGFVAAFAYGRGPQTSGLLTGVSSSQYPYNEWYWITGVYDADRDSAYLYVGSCLEGKSADQSPDDWITTGQYLMTGRFNETEYFKGKMDQISIYNKVIIPDFAGGKCDTVSTGIRDWEQINISLSPNPSRGQLNLNSPEVAIELIQLFDLTGRRIAAAVSEGRHERVIQTDYHGLAIVKVKTSKGILTRKVVFE